MDPAEPSRFETGLNPEQRTAVRHVDGPMLVLAGAGSGKTRVITHRVARLIDVGACSPDAILALTFTNKAAREMRERTERLLGTSSLPCTITTFHSACARWARRLAPRLGLSASFSIYDDDDQLRLLRQVATELGLPDDLAAARAARERIDRIRNEALTLHEVQTRAIGREAEQFARLYAAFDRALDRANALDFGGLISRLVHLLESDATERDRFRHRYRQVMVDEFQDTNVAQYRLLAALVPPEGNLVVVGDDDQSIYRWRGASVENVRRFLRDHPGCPVVALERNYRSIGSILAGAHDIVRHLPERMPKTLRAERSGDAPIRVMVARDDREEADWLARTITALRAERSGAWGDFAIFYRTNAQSRILEERLRAAGIPHRIWGGTSFFDRAEIRDLLAWLRLAANPADRVAFSRVINTPARGIGKTTEAMIGVALAAAPSGPIHRVLRELLETPVARLTRKAREGIIGLAALLEQLADGASRFGPAELVDLVLTETGYARWLTDSDPASADDRLRNLAELRRAADEFATGDEPVRDVAAFLEYTALRQPGVVGVGDSSSVALLTVHGAKGLEFPVVFVTGLERDLFPLVRRGGELTPEEADEERRLAYVAFTRAMDVLFVSATMRRQLYGSARRNEASPFLRDLARERVVFVPESAATSLDWETAPTGRAFAMSTGEPARWDEHDQRPWQERLGRKDGGTIPEEGVVFDDAWYPSDKVESARAHIGRRARHSLFGVGVVREADPSGDKVRLAIEFPGVGVKRVILQYVEFVD